MNHPRPEDLSAYVDGALTAVQLRAIADHVSTCPTCARSVRDWETMRNVIRSAAAVEPEAWFAERMEAMVMGEEAELERWLGAQRVAAQAVIGLAILVLGLAAMLTLRPSTASNGAERLLAVGSGDSTLLMASSELTRENLLQATIVGE